VPSVDISNATYDSATSQYVFSDQATTSSASYQQPTTYENAPVYAHQAPGIPALPQSFDTTASSSSLYAEPAPVASTTYASAPTDSAFASQEVTGTPGFMALQAQQQSVAVAQAAPALPQAQIVTSAPVYAAGTPVAYDYSRNIISADAVTTGQQLPEDVRVLQGGTFQSGSFGSAQSYTVQPGDTVYNLSKRTCVGVNIIQSMNGLNADYGINIGQTIRLPASVC